MAGGFHRAGLCRLASLAGAGLNAILGAGGGRGDRPCAESMSCAREVHIAHIVQGGLTVLEAVVRNQRIAGLIGGHAVDFAAYITGRVFQHMSETAALLHIEGQQGVHSGLAVLDKAGVGIGIDAPRGGGHDHLRDALGVDAAPGGIAAVILLDRGQLGKSALGSSCHLRLILIIDQRLQRHSRDIGIRLSAAQRPAAAGQLLAEDIVNTLLADGGVGGGIVVRIQRNQREDGAVDPLLGDPLHSLRAVGLDEIPVSHAGGIFADGGQRHDQAGILSGLHLMQRAVQIDGSRLLIDGLHNAAIVILEILAVQRIVAAAGQIQNRPFTGAGAKGGRGNGLGQLVHGVVQHLADILRCGRRGIAGVGIAGIRVAGVGGAGIGGTGSLQRGKSRIHLTLRSGQVFHNGKSRSLGLSIGAEGILGIEHVLVGSVKVSCAAPAAKTKIHTITIQSKLPADHIGIAIVLIAVTIARPSNTRFQYKCGAAHIG